MGDVYKLLCSIYLFVFSLSLFFSFRFFLLFGPFCIWSFISYLFSFTFFTISVSVRYLTLMGPSRELSKVWPKGREQNWKREGEKEWEKEKKREREAVVADSSWKGSFSFLFISRRLPAYLASPPLFSRAHKSPFSLAHMYANKASYANETGRDWQWQGRRNGLRERGEEGGEDRMKGRGTAG